MHGPLGCAHVDTVKLNLGCQDVAQGGASRGVAVVDKHLAGDISPFAYATEHRRRPRVGHILAVGVDFNHRAVAWDRMVGGILLRRIVGVEGMAVVGRHHEGVGHSAGICLEIATQTLENPPQNRRCGSLLGARAGLLVVEYGHHPGHRVGPTRLRRSGKGRDSRVGHLQVVDTARGYEFLIKPEEARRSGVVKRQVKVENLLRSHTQLGGDHTGEQPLPLLFRGDASQHREHVALLRQGVAVIDRAVVMDGQVGDGEQRTAEIDKASDGAQRRLATQNHAA